MHKRRRHNDGLKELAKSVHGKAKSLIAHVRDLLKSSDDPKRKSILKKIEVALAATASASLLIFTAKSAKEALKAAHDFHMVKDVLGKYVGRYISPDIFEGGYPKVVEESKKRLFEKEAKVFLGLCGALVSAITAFKIGMKKETNEAYEANYEANYEPKRDSMYKRRKHNDGLKELAKSVHGKAKSLVADVRDLLKSSDDPKRKYMLKRIEVALASMASASLLIFTAKSAKEALKAAHDFHTRKNILDEMIDRYVTTDLLDNGYQKVIDRARNRLFKKKAKLFLGLCGTLASAITAFAVGLKKESNGAYEANYEANYEQKKDSMYKTIRHNDGIREAAKTLISKIKIFIDKFKNLKPAGKVIFLLNKIVQALAAFYTAKSLYEMKRELSLISKYKKSLGSPTILTPTGELGSKDIVFTNGLRAIVGLVATFISLSKDKIMLEGLPDGYDADYEASYEAKKDSMYRMRKSDKIAKHLRHNDGIRDVAKTLIGKIKVFIDKFKNLKPAGKVIFLLNKIIQALAAFYTAKNLYEMKKQLSLISEYKKSLGDPAILGFVGDRGNKDIAFTSGLKAIAGLVATFVLLSKDKVMLEGLPDGYDADYES